MAIPSTASRWQPAPPTDGEQQTHCGGNPDSSVVKAFPGSNRLRPRCWVFLHHEHIARHGSGPRPGCDATCSAKASHRGLNSATPAAAASARHTERGRSVTLCASEIRSGNSSPAENSRSPEAPASASLSLMFPPARSSSGVGVKIRSEPRRCITGSSAQNFSNRPRYFFQLSVDSSDLLSKSGNPSLFCLVMPMAKPSRCLLSSKMRFTGSRNL